MTDRRKQIVDALQPLAERAFCPTGEGGGVDNSCSPAAGAVSSKIAKANELTEKLLSIQQLITDDKPKDARKYLEERGWELDDYTEDEIEKEAEYEFAKQSKELGKQEDETYWAIQKVVKSMSKKDKLAFVAGLNEAARIALFDGADLEEFGLDESYFK